MDKNFHIQNIFNHMIDDVQYVQRNYLIRKRKK